MSAPLLRELYLDPIHESRRAGVLIGDLVVAPFVEATPDVTSEASARTVSQLEEVLGAMAQVLERVAANLDDVLRVTFYLRDLAERPLLNASWSRVFPDPAARPPHKYLPSSLLSAGVNVAIGFLAQRGGSREVLEIAGLVHGDPMSLGQRAGNIVTSSRLFARESEREAQLDLILERVGLLLAAAGGGLANLTQATFFVGSSATSRTVEEHLAAAGTFAASSPTVHLVETDLGGGEYSARVEILGLL